MAKNLSMNALAHEFVDDLNCNSSQEPRFNILPSRKVMLVEDVRSGVMVARTETAISRDEVQDELCLSSSGVRFVKTNLRADGSLNWSKVCLESLNGHMTCLEAGHDHLLYRARVNACVVERKVPFLMGSEGPWFEQPIPKVGFGRNTEEDWPEPLPGSGQRFELQTIDDAVAELLPLLPQVPKLSECSSIFTSLEPGQELNDETRNYALRRWISRNCHSGNAHLSCPPKTGLANHHTKVAKPILITAEAGEAFLLLLCRSTSKRGVIVSNGQTSMLTVPIHRNPKTRDCPKTRYLVAVAGGTCKHAAVGEASVHVMSVGQTLIESILRVNYQATLSMGATQDALHMDRNLGLTSTGELDPFFLLVHIVSGGRRSQLGQQTLARLAGGEAVLKGAAKAIAKDLQDCMQACALKDKVTFSDFGYQLSIIHQVLSNMIVGQAS